MIDLIGEFLVTFGGGIVGGTISMSVYFLGQVVWEIWTGA